MKRLFDEGLLKNKVVALILVMVFDLTVLVQMGLVPIVMFLTVPTALVLTFSKKDWIN